MMKVKDEVLACGSFQIMDGTQTRFWEIHGLALGLSKRFSLLYIILHIIHTLQWQVLCRLYRSTFPLGKR
jgi:hypothetical protein